MKVYVGLSGGVDSAVSAALLKERGFEVVGCFIKIWQPEFIECTWREDRLDAMRVAAALGIPFKEVDLSDEYKREVVEPMIATYARGETPNPDVLCNEKVKFGHFAAWAFADGAERIATGHYARICPVANRRPPHTAAAELAALKQASPQYVAGDSSMLCRSRDTTKDQSYFLYRIEQETLGRALFPIGDMHKAEVRRLAAKFDLPVSSKPDSQGLCFVGDVSMKDFLARYVPLTPGSVIDMQGSVVGTHDGAVLYTRGERHGFRAKGGVWYVVRTDVEKNIVYVSGNRADVLSSRMRLRDIHWINPVALLLTASVQVRYHTTPVSATIAEENGATEVVFTEPQVASPGQSLVVYDGDVCMGGAVLAES